MHRLFRFLTRVCPEVHFQTRLSFKFLLANLTLMHSGFIPVNKPITKEG